ncbi:MAG: glycosyltransferase [Sulfuritalea sp.]|nr:glycosyltransferase [Sulfuritalea sp.]
MTTSLKGLVSSWLSNLLSNITRYKIVKIAQQGNFDVIHLNSLVLFPLADSRFPFVVHVRELIDSDFKNVLPKYVKEARGIIFIDDVVAEPFEKLTIPYRLVLANPFNLLNQNEMQLTKAHLEFLERIRDKFVIAIVGRVTVEKGIAFLLKFLSKFPDPRINLVVVGDGEMLFSCEQFALKDKRLIVLGEQENVSFIYKHADLVVRGDDIPRVGRTVYEAVLSGACVLLPGVSANYPSDLLERFPEQVLFYQTRSVGDFTSRVEELLAREKKRAKDGVAGGGYEVNSLLEFYREASVHSIN